MRYEPTSKVLSMKINRLGNNSMYQLICGSLNDAYLHIASSGNTHSVTVSELTQAEIETYFLYFFFYYLFPTSSFLHYSIRKKMKKK